MPTLRLPSRATSCIVAPHALTREANLRQNAGHAVGTLFLHLARAGIRDPLLKLAWNGQVPLATQQEANPASRHSNWWELLASIPNHIPASGLTGAFRTIVRRWIPY